MAELLNTEALGTDLALSSDRDIAVSGRDFGTVSGVPNVVVAFMRALGTPYGYLARFLRDHEGLKVVDETYGNPAYYILSEPISQPWLEAVVQFIHDVADGQPRLMLLNVDYDLFNLEVQRVKFNIRFQVLGDPREFNLVLARDGSAIRTQLV